MYKNRITKLSILILLIQLMVEIYCKHPLTCSFYCCYFKYKHESSSNANTNCKLSCHLQSLSGVIYNITNTYMQPSNFSGLSDNSTLDALNKCIKQCPDVMYQSYDYYCDDKCCKEYTLPGKRRTDNPDACCDNVTMVNIKTVNPSDVMDCMVSNSTCNTKGYNLLLKGNRTYCASLDSSSPDIGADYGFEGGCRSLYKGSDNSTYKIPFLEQMLEYYLASL
ncbi:CNPV083 CC chemokine-like protein [Canarypox virus]|uniref:CNPV083 CC chemokine-like protein n=1 Tax=Canarypox virus TaxID=44088 RepID=Q6VZR4_CNPV|nr:CNPV083 CC chemokine-like protein [Canarypox virus]AAR83429.1 CNPV083 CC chemokine-like protein [Canarypox virus]AWD84559.1 CC chemokine-like protein [Canarypox virus]